MRRMLQRLSLPLRTITYFFMALAGVFAMLGLACIAIENMERERATSPSCASNLKQVSVGFLQYMQDYDETWPIGTRINRIGSYVRKDTSGEAEYHTGQGWAGAIYPYVKNTQVFQCPQEARLAAEGLFPVSYAYNRNLALNVKTANVIAPGLTVLLAEIAGDNANMLNAEERSNGNVYSAAGNGLTLAMTAATLEPEAKDAHYVTGMSGGYGTTGCALPPFATSLTNEYRHNDGANFAMADGHVKFHRPNSVSPGSNAANAHQPQDCTRGRAAGTQSLHTFAITFSTK